MTEGENFQFSTVTTITRGKVACALDTERATLLTDIMELIVDRLLPCPSRGTVRASEQAESKKTTEAEATRRLIFFIRETKRNALRYNERHMERNNLAIGLLTTALVLVFGYFGIDKFLHPILWIQWIPAWMDGLLNIPKETWLTIIGCIEIFLALLLLIPNRTVRKLGVFLMILELLGILTQVGINDIGIRDAAILLSALSLAALL